MTCWDHGGKTLSLEANLILLASVALGVLMDLGNWRNALDLIEAQSRFLKAGYWSSVISAFMAMLEAKLFPLNQAWYAGL